MEPFKFPTVYKNIPVSYSNHSETPIESVTKKFARQLDDICRETGKRPVFGEMAERTDDNKNKTYYFSITLEDI